MKRRRYGMVVFVLALALTQQAWAQGSDVESVLKAREAALIARDFDRALGLFADDAIVVTSSGRLLIGKEQLRVWVQDQIDRRQREEAGSRQVQGSKLSVALLLGRSASESGRLRQAAEGHPRDDRRGSGLMLTILPTDYEARGEPTRIRHLPWAGFPRLRWQRLRRPHRRTTFSSAPHRRVGNRRAATQSCTESSAICRRRPRRPMCLPAAPCYPENVWPTAYSVELQSSARPA